MGFYAEHILPRCVDFTLSTRPVMKARARVTQGLRGEVLEIGFGSGLNLPFYPSGVSKIYAVEPAQLGRKLARERMRACAIPIDFAGLDGQALGLPDASVDAVLSTFTFCTIPDLGRALGELRRVLRRGGQLHFLEHGRSPELAIARWQDRLDPIQQRLAGGCHLNRAIDEQLRAAGFCLDSLDNYYLRGPKVGTYMFEGRARVCDKPGVHGAG